jgi:hypothetical protein
VLQALRRGWIHMEDVSAEPAHGGVPDPSGAPG